MNRQPTSGHRSPHFQLRAHQTHYFIRCTDLVWFDCVLDCPNSPDEQFAWPPHGPPRIREAENDCAASVATTTISSPT